MIIAMLERARLVIALVVSAAGAALWAAEVTLVTPAALASVRRLDANFVEAKEMAGGDVLQWMQGMRWVTLVVIVCGLALMVRGPGVWRQVGPAACGVAVFAADAAFAAADATGWGAAVMALAVMSAIIAIGGKVLRAGEAGEGPSQHLAGYGVLAAWCAPLPLTDASYSGVRPFLPVGLIASMGVVMLLLVLAATCIAFARPRTPRATVPAAVGFATLLGFAALLGTVGILNTGKEPLFGLAYLGGVPVAVVLLLAVRPRSVLRSGTVAAGITVAYPVMLFVSLFVFAPVTAAADALADDGGHLAHSLSLTPSSMATGMAAGVVVWALLSWRGMRELPWNAIRLRILHHAAQSEIHSAWMTRLTSRELAGQGYPISPGTLYPTLRRLEGQGLLISECRVVKGRVRRVYTATKAGHAVLAAERAKPEDGGGGD
ncbi:hypothetical protein GCM10010191_57810 [Actinomadura vinacea]|uniref:Transcription regulator PadR N-terminal domain-containing protein n=1 Tax=Actinomadura vinacea TaxID=115336 RepID=A0ABP5WSZ3_9ACTN